MSKLDLTLFNGGMADIETPSDRRHGEKVENLNVTASAKLRSREGSEILDSDATTTVAPAGQTQALINYDEDRHLLVLAGQRAFSKNAASYVAADGWDEILSPNSGFQALPANGSLTAAMALNALQWKSHALVVGQDPSSEVLVSPQKFYLDQNNDWQVRNASIEAPLSRFSTANYAYVLASSIHLANELRTKFNSHVTTVGTHHIVGATPISAPAATDEESLVTLTLELAEDLNSHTRDAEKRSVSNVHGLDSAYLAKEVVVGGNFFVPHTKPVNAFDCAELLNKLRFAFNCHTVAFLARKDGEFPNGNPVSGVITWDVAANTFDCTTIQFMRTGDEVFFTTNTLPTGITEHTTYYLIREFGATTYTKAKVATTFANALAGIAVDVSGVPGTNRIRAPGQNLHALTSSPVSAAPVLVGGFWPFSSSSERFLSGTPLGYSVGLPHVAAEWTDDVATVVSEFYNHLISSNHANTIVRGYMESPEKFMNGQTVFGFGIIPEDYQVLMAIMKAHHAFRAHRDDQGPGLYHSTSTTDPADSALAKSEVDYYSGPVPDVNSSTFWNEVATLFNDFSDNFNGESTSHVLGTSYGGGARHSGTIPTQTQNNGRKYDWEFANISYAVMAKSRRTLHNKTVFEDLSAPLMIGSFCIATKKTVTTHIARIEAGVNSASRLALVSGDITYPEYYLGSFWLSTSFDSGFWYGSKPKLIADENVDSSEVTIEIYRTLQNGANYYLEGSYQNADGESYKLRATDDEIEALAQELYTTGGVVAFDPAPRAVAATVVRDTAYYGGIAEIAAPRLTVVTFSVGTTMTSPGHELIVGDRVFFVNPSVPLVDDTLPRDLERGRGYYVVSVSGDDFTVSETPGGTPVSISATYTETSYVAQEKFQHLSRRVRQSFPGNIFSSPATFYVDVDSDIVTMSSAKEHPVAICKEGVYRIEGQFSETGTGGMIAKQISERVGGVSANCAISVNGICFFMGRDGFYMTDGYSVKPLTPHMKRMVTDTISQDLFTHDSVRSAVKCTYDSTHNRVLWSVGSELWVLHVSHSEESGCFSTWNNSSHFAPTAVAFFRGAVIRGDEDGLLFAHRSTLKSDPKVDRGSGSLLADGNGTRLTAHLPFRFRTLPENFGSVGARKWVSKVLLQLANLGSATLGLFSINDRNTAHASPMKGIRFRGEYSGQLKESRTFPAGRVGTRFQGLRCHEKQLEIAPESVVLYRSDDLGLCTVAGSVATLGASWPVLAGSLVGSTIHFEADDYVTGYVITDVAGAALTATGMPVGAAQAWVIKGYPKDEVLELQSLSIEYTPVESQPNPPTGQTGGNA